MRGHAHALMQPSDHFFAIFVRYMLISVVEPVHHFCLRVPYYTPDFHWNFVVVSLSLIRSAFKDDWRVVEEPT